MSPEDQKRAAAERAVLEVEDGMRLGLGTGSTAAYFVRALGERVRQGLRVVGVPTSEATRRLAQEQGIALTTLDETPWLDLTVDGADEIGPDLVLVKGGGGALVREKIVAQASARMIVIADASKRVNELGRYPLPVAVLPFGLKATIHALEEATRAIGVGGAVLVREGPEGEPVTSDDGLYILDCQYRRIPDPEALAIALSSIAGVVEHGLFIGLATKALIGAPDGVQVIEERGLG